MAGLFQRSDSPRADLLKASFKIEQATYDELKTYTNDPRSDVSNIAQSKLIENMQEADTLRTQFLRDIFEEKLPSKLLRQIDKKMTPFKGDELVACAKLIKSENPRIRFHAMRALENGLISIDEARIYAEEMTSDPEQEIRDRAYRFLDSLKQD